MDNILEPVNISSFQRIFHQSEKKTLQEAIRLTRMLNSGFNNLTIDSYVKIPHCLSSIVQKNEIIRIDTFRNTKYDDRYIQEEALMVPPEAINDRMWRRKVTRITYLISQFFFGIITGEIPTKEAIDSSESLLQNRSSKEGKTIKKFLSIGLANEPSQRFANFDQIDHILEELQKNFSRVWSPEVTAINLPKLPRFSSKKTINYQGPKSTSRNPLFEIHVWSSHHDIANKAIIESPAEVTIGRKVISHDSATSIKEKKMKNAENFAKFVLEKNLQNGINQYTLLIEKDPCLSRKHLKLFFPNNANEKLHFKDMGSTHGVIMYLDKTRNLLHSQTIKSYGKSQFACPEDQYLQLGNTYLRIRSYKEKA